MKLKHILFKDFQKMMNFDLIDSLGDKYDIDIEDYWDLSNEDKDKISIIVIQFIYGTLKHQIETLPIYIRLIDDRVKSAEYHEEYEQAEIFNRIKKELLKIFPIY